MGFGRVLSSCPVSLLPACVCVLAMLTVSDGRPNLISFPNQKTTKDRDSWRAFEPAKEASRTSWWKEKLDDDLWNPKSPEQQPPSSPLENVVPTQTNPAAATNAAVEPEGEKKVTSNVSKPEAKAQTSTPEPATAKPPQPELPPFRKGEVNKFVEPEPGSDYRLSGEYYGRNSWVSPNSQPTQRNESTVPKENPENHASLEPHLPLENKKTTTEESNQPRDHQNSKSQEESSSPLKESPHGNNPAPLINTQHEAEPMHEIVAATESKEVVQLNPEPIMELKAASSDEHSHVEDSAKNVAISNTNEPVITPEEKTKMTNAVEDHKVGASIKEKTDLVINQAEILSPGQASDFKDPESEEVSEKATKKPEEATTKKPSSEFVDWEDWDNSAFDYYDNDETGNSKNDKNGSKNDKNGSKNDQNGSNNDKNGSKNDMNGSKKDNIVVSNDSIKVNKKVEKDPVDDDSNDKDEEDGFYDDDDDEYDDEDDATDKIVLPGLMTEKAEKAVTPTKSDKNNLSAKLQTPSPSPKIFDLDTLAIQSDEAANHGDHTHYSKGVIYDSNYPDHKPSVKKDLANSVSIENDEPLSESNTAEEPSPSGSIDQMNMSVKKTLSVTHVQSDQLNTESDVSTSPNPPPPGVASSKESPGTVTQGTTPIPRTHQTSAPADIQNGDRDINNGFILSFPLEFCRVDYECRAGRTCILGVCKCYTPSMCGGHHKPICGSDGVKYASHCELHRTACVNRVHIRADRRGRCFQKEIEEHEKSWLMEQERLLQEDREKAKSQSQSDKSQFQSVEPYAMSLKSESGLADVHTAPSETADSTSTVTEKTTTTETVTKASRDCSWKDMAKFKNDLLTYYCQKFVEPNCKEEVKTDREYLSMLMFSYYDRDYDYYLTAKELDDKERDEHFSSNIILNCHLHDFINFADNLEADGKLTVSEFTSSFEPPIPSIPPHAHVEVLSTLASAGNGLELKCGIDAEKVVWRRHGALLSDDKRSHQLMVFDDGALFFSTIGLHHIGNYTCMDSNDESNAQIHRLKVQTVPVVEVSPVTQTHLTGSDVELKCHAEGVPEPTISWNQAGEPLPHSSHVTHYYGGGHVVIHNAQYDADAGTYTCTAHNQAGTTEKSVSVSVLSPNASSSKESARMAGTFVVFHSKGISAYDPLNCLPRHEVSGDFGNFKFIPDALDGPLTLCRKADDCQWGSAVRVGSEFIFVSQPDQNRVVMMNAVDTLNPLQVIDTDKRPEKLWYVKHLDQVWVLCGNEESGEGNKTIVVIRDASQHIQHRSVHTQPVGNHFDMVQDVFIAPPNDLNHEFDFGYVSHTGQNGLFKINLEDMSYTKSIDLTNYGCVPTNIAFVPIGGHVVLQCVSFVDQHTLQLTMDYLTDTITSATSHNGRPMVSPDSRFLVTVDMLTGKVIVSSISEEGFLETTYDVTVSASISDVAFMSAMFHRGYDLVMTSSDDNDVIIMNLATGKVEKLKGSRYSENSKSWNTNPSSRHIVAGNSMSNYLMAPSKSSLAILDARFKEVECEFPQTVGSDVMIYIPSIYTS